MSSAADTGLGVLGGAADRLPADTRRTDVVGARRVDPAAARAELAERFAQPMRTLGELRLAAADAGCPFAAVYVEGARGALRHALAALSKGIGGRPVVDPEGQPLALGIGDLAVIVDGGQLVGRGRLSVSEAGVSFAPEPDADVDAEPVAPQLADDLLADDAMRRLARGPGFASLLAAAIGNHRWIHLASGRTSSLDVPAASTVASLVSGGRPVRRWPASVAPGLLDRRVCEELGRLGWRRLAPPEHSDEAARRSCRELGLVAPGEPCGR